MYPLQITHTTSDAPVIKPLAEKLFERPAEDRATVITAYLDAAAAVLKMPGGVSETSLWADITSLRPLDASLMPIGPEGGISVAQMADLLTFPGGGTASSEQPEQPGIHDQTQHPLPCPRPADSPPRSVRQWPPSLKTLMSTC